MKTSMKIMFGIMTVFFIAIVSLGTIFAYRGNPDVKGPNYSESVHEELTEAIEKGDYDLWISIRKENNLPMTGRMFQTLNKDNFGKYSEMHNAMISGDTEKADAIRAELGLNTGYGGMGQGKGNGCAMHNAGNTGTGSQCGMKKSSCGSCPYKN